MKKYIDEHLSKGFIRSSSLVAATSVLLIWKPGGGLQFCVDYCALNKITIKNQYLIPLINKTLAKLADTVHFIKLDVIQAFKKIQIKERQEWLTAFNTRYDQFEYLMMLFGLCNAPGTFQSYINKFLCKYVDVFCTAYFNNVVVYSSNEKDHATDILKVLKDLRKRGLQLTLINASFPSPEWNILAWLSIPTALAWTPKKYSIFLTERRQTQ